MACEYRLVQKGRAIAPGKAHHQPFMNILCVALEDLGIVGFHCVRSEGCGWCQMRRGEVCKNWNPGRSFGCKVGSIGEDEK